MISGKVSIEGYEVIAMEEAIVEDQISVATTGYCDIIVRRHFETMKDDIIVCNIDHFDVGIDAVLLKANSASISNIKHQVDCFTMKSRNHVIFLAEGRLGNLGCATGHPLSSCPTPSSTCVLAQNALWTDPIDGLLVFKSFSR